MTRWGSSPDRFKRALKVGYVRHRFLVGLTEPIFCDGWPARRTVEPQSQQRQNRSGQFEIVLHERWTASMGSCPSSRKCLSDSAVGPEFHVYQSM